MKGATEPTRHLFIYRVDSATTEGDITSLLQESEVKFDVRDLKCVSHPNAKFKSFKLTVPMSQYENLFNDQLWPDGICVRKYVAPRPDY